ncbi:MAG: nicotinate phosphoribosyltransferase [Betaproteobacteria bacterium RIFCSPLOWO2_02_FULL_65_20]|nr:MAG: nicotinate phosphoribosyltransferase [Betaproteobacteria bacterium RIFCSPLOWO2_02_FULL_65_20]
MTDPAASALLTDLYELTMLQAYYDRGMNGAAVFEFFSRKLPRERNFLMAAGLEQVLDYLCGLRITSEELAFLDSTGRFSAGFLMSLEDLRFTGRVVAMPEGTLFFADEPILRVIAPLREAQLVESRIVNLLHFQTVVASKAARCALVAPGKLLVDFGLRRAHGAEAGLLSARASYIAGFSGSATVLAGMRFGVPVFGTMAHSFIQAHASELQAFENFARSHPANATLLIDTYDTVEAATKVVELAARLAREGIAVRGVRIDSGDLGGYARQVRRVLDEGGMSQITIFASSGLDEYALRDLAAAPIDGFGVGTRMNTSADAPYLDCAYKLVEYEGRPKRKRSEGKATWPGRKQIYRRVDAGGRIAGDVLTVEGDRQQGAPLLRAVMTDGSRIAESPSTEAVRAHARAQLASLPARLASLERAQPLVPAVSEALRALAAEADRDAGR